MKMNVLTNVWGSLSALFSVTDKACQYNYIFDIEIIDTKW